MAKKKIGILGGAFNPPHNGHLALARLAAKHFDEVWLQPCSNHPDKYLLDIKQRLAMCQLAVVPYFPKIRASGFEAINRFKGSSYEMLVALRKDEPESKFSFIIGQDNADDIESWRHYDNLISEIPFFVVPRKGCEKKEKTWYMKGHHTHLSLPEDEAIVEVNSTEIRKQIRSGKEDGTHLDKMVWNYIRNQGLYRS